MNLERTQAAYVRTQMGLLQQEASAVKAGNVEQANQFRAMSAKLSLNWAYLHGAMAARAGRAS